jgi:hypothetical protein
MMNASMSRWTIRAAKDDKDNEAMNRLSSLDESFIIMAASTPIALSDW